MSDPSPEDRWSLIEREFALVRRNLRSAFQGIGQLFDSGVTWINEHQEEISAFWGRAADDDRHKAWDYLLKRVDVFNGMTIRLALEMKRTLPRASLEQRDELLAVTFSDGLTEPGTIEAVLAGLELAPLPEVTKQQLAHGVQLLVSGEYHLAVPALIGPLEGVFWRTARQRGLIELDKRGAWRTTANASRPRVRIDAIEKLSTYLLADDPEFGSFLRSVAYGSEGHPYRHGFAEDRWHVRALCLLVVLIGWLELVDVVDSGEVIHGGFQRAKQAKRANEVERQPPATRRSGDADLP